MNDEWFMMQEWRAKDDEWMMMNEWMMAKEWMKIHGWMKMNEWWKNKWWMMNEEWMMNACNRTHTWSFMPSWNRFHVLLSNLSVCNTAWQNGWSSRCRRVTVHPQGARLHLRLCPCCRQNLQTSIAFLANLHACHWQTWRLCLVVWLIITTIPDIVKHRATESPANIVSKGLLRHTCRRWISSVN
jgi:hypothetical protein